MAPPIDCYRSAVSELRFSIIGPVRAWLDDRELDLGPGKQRAVLAVLLLEANAPVPAGKIVDAVWGERPPENGVNVVQKYVAGLRRVLEPDRSPRAPGRLLTLDDAGYRLTVAPDSLDTTAIATTVRAGQVARAEGRLPEAAGLLRRALDGWSGERGRPNAQFGAGRSGSPTAGQGWEALATWSRGSATRRVVADLTPLVAVSGPRRAALPPMLALHRAGRAQRRRGLTRRPRYSSRVRGRAVRAPPELHRRIPRGAGGPRTASGSLAADDGGPGPTVAAGTERRRGRPSRLA